MSSDATLSDTFSALFRQEHRQVRDLLLELVETFERRDAARAGELLGQAARLAGPHFRYEEEALYPALVDFFGKAYVQELLAAHDRAIAGARRLVTLAGGALGAREAAEATAIIRGILPHVSDCEGLSIMVERMPESTVAAVLQARQRALAEGLDLLTWASEVRGRPA